MFEKDEEQPRTKEITVSFIKNKDGGNNGDS